MIRFAFGMVTLDFGGNKIGNWLKVGRWGLPAEGRCSDPERCEEKGLDKSSSVADGEGGSE